MRFVALAILILFLAAGVVVGALNADLVGYDLGVARLRVPKGGALLAVMLLGWLLGGLTAWLGMVLAGRRRGRRGTAGGKATARP